MVATGTGSSGPAQSGDLDLFSEASGRTDDSTKKPLSKDSILSLYGSGGMAQQPAPGRSLLAPAQSIP